MQIGMLGSLKGNVPPSRSRPPRALGSPLDPARHGPRRILGRGRTPPSWWSPPSRRSWAQLCWQPGRVHNPDLGQQTLPGSESQGEGTGGVLAAWPPRCPRQAVPAKRRVTLSRSSPSQEPLFPGTHRDLITLPALFCVTARAVAFCHQKLTWAYIRPAKMTQTGLRLEVPPRGTVAQVIPTAAPSYLPSIHPSTCTFARLRAHLPTRPPAIHPPRTSRHLPAYPSTYPPPICPFTRFSALYLPLRPLTFLLCAQTRFQTRY